MAAMVVVEALHGVGRPCLFECGINRIQVRESPVHAIISLA
jgi:hypothetical protein